MNRWEITYVNDYILAPRKLKYLSQTPEMTIAVVGIGLIGGSLMIDLRKRGFADKIIGVDANHAAPEYCPALRTG